VLIAADETHDHDELLDALDQVITEDFNDYHNVLSRKTHTISLTSFEAGEHLILAYTPVSNLVYK